MKIHTFPFGPLASNMYIVEVGGSFVVVDPSVTLDKLAGLGRAFDPAALKAVFITHGHFDHMLGLDRLRSECPEAEVAIHAHDAELMSDAHKNAFYDIFKKERDFGTPDKLLIQGDVIEFGNEKITVLHTPGHTAGSVCYKLGRVMFTGDTVMADGYGRCDLYSGDTNKMNFTLNRLYAMSEKEAPIVIYPGHGNSSSLSDAMRSIYK